MLLIDAAAKGRHIAAIERAVLAAACADAENCLYASFSDASMAKKMKKYPAPKATPEVVGIVGLIGGEAVHPSQNRAIVTLWLLV